MQRMMTESGASFARRVRDDPGLIDTLHARARILAAIRSFFASRDFVEVTTPCLALTADPALHLDSFSTRLRLAGAPDRTLFLPTSPEFHMKRMLTGGMERIFQIGPFFRNAELTTQHNPEFTGLEWYQVGCTVEQMMDFTEDLVRMVAKIASSGQFSNAAFGRYTVLGAICELGGIELPEDFNENETRAVLDRAGVTTAPDDSLDDLINRVLIERVEDKLKAIGPVFLCDYPAQMAALARLKRNQPWLAERFELYAGGLELCNGYGELTDAREQRDRFDVQRAARSRLGRQVPDLDERFLAALEEGLPQCSGCALGVDRLVMFVCAKESIEQVMAFPLARELDLSDS